MQPAFRAVHVYTDLWPNHPAIQTFACAWLPIRDDNTACAEIPMQVLNVEPAQLTQLIREMVRVKGNSRPNLTNVYRRLLDIKYASFARGLKDTTVSNRFLLAPASCNWPMCETREWQREHASDQDTSGRVEVTASPVLVALTDVLGGDLNNGKHWFLHLQPPPRSAYPEDQIKYLRMSGTPKDRRDAWSEYMYTDGSAPDDMHLSFQLKEHTDSYRVLISASQGQPLSQAEISSSERCSACRYFSSSRTGTSGTCAPDAFVILRCTDAFAVCVAAW